MQVVLVLCKLVLVVLVAVEMVEATLLVLLVQRTLAVVVAVLA